MKAFCDLNVIGVFDFSGNDEVVGGKCYFSFYLVCFVERWNGEDREEKRIKIRIKRGLES